MHSALSLIVIVVMPAPMSFCCTGYRVHVKSVLTITATTKLHGKNHLNIINAAPERSINTQQSDLLAETQTPHHTPNRR